MIKWQLWWTKMYTFRYTYLRIVRCHKKCRSPVLFKFWTKRPNPVAVMFSEEFIRGDIAVGEFASKWVGICRRLVPHVDKAPLPLRILRLVTSNFLPVENPTHPTAHAPERSSVYILGQFCTSKWEMNMYWKLRRFAALSFRYEAFQILLFLVISILIIFSMWLDFDVLMWRYLSK